MVSPGAVQAFAFDEADAADPILLQVEENEARVRLSRADLFALAMVILFGLFSATALNMVVVPVAYFKFSRRR